jgi:glutamine synthetase
MIRIPAKKGKATRTEIRSVDPSTNPYLAMSAILASGLEGIEKKLECPERVYINLYELSREEREGMGIQNLPENLKDAVKELKKSDVIKEAIGPHVFQRFCDAKQKEWDEFRTSVTKWELEKYLKLM